MSLVRLADSGEQEGDITALSLTWPGVLVTAIIPGSGGAQPLKIITWDIANNGTITRLKDFQAASISQIALIRHGIGVVTGHREVSELSMIRNRFCLHSVYLDYCWFGVIVYCWFCIIIACQSIAPHPLPT